MVEKAFGTHISHLNKRREKGASKKKLVQRTTVGLKKATNESGRDDGNKTKRRGQKPVRDAPEQMKKSSVRKMNDHHQKRFKNKEEFVQGKKNVSSGLHALRNETEKLKGKKDAKKKKSSTTDSGLRRIQVKVPTQLNERTKVYKKEVPESDEVPTRSLNQRRDDNEDGQEELESKMSDFSSEYGHEDVGKDRSLNELGREALGVALQNADNAVLTLGYYVSEGVEATLDAVNKNESNFSSKSSPIHLSLFSFHPLHHSSFL